MKNQYGHFNQPTVDQEVLENPNVEDLSDYFVRETPIVLSKLQQMAVDNASSVGESMHSGAETAVNALAKWLLDNSEVGMKGSHELLYGQETGHSMIDRLIEDFSYFKKGIQDTDEPWFNTK
tara:strand:+ start:2318 stop:2683 length:366 start_codon:yes stop_codon:yes gene_type:complete